MVRLWWELSSMCIVCCKRSQGHKNSTDTLTGHAVLTSFIVIVYVLQDLRHKSCFTCFLHFPLRFGIAVKLWAKDAQLPLGQRHSVEVPFWPFPPTTECLSFESSGSRDSWAKPQRILHMRPHWRFSLVTSQLWGVAPKMAICLRTMARMHASSMLIRFEQSRKILPKFGSNRQSDQGRTLESFFKRVVIRCGPESKKVWSNARQFHGQSMNGKNPWLDMTNEFAGSTKVCFYPHGLVLSASGRGWAPQRSCWIPEKNLSGLYSE